MKMWYRKPVYSSVYTDHMRTCGQEYSTSTFTHLITAHRNRSNSSPTVNTLFLSLLCLHLPAFEFECMVSHSLFLMQLTGRANENITRCLKAAIEMLECEEHCLRDFPSGCREQRNISISISLFSLFYLCPKMATFTQTHTAGACVL